MSEAVVSKPGRKAKVCVSLESDGQEVAGTQNDLIWDGDCATLNPGRCKVAAPGKDLSTAFPPGTSFTMRAFVLGLDSLDPIPDGDLYCCDFTSELTGEGFCPIQITNALGADPSGRAVATTSEGGGIRFDELADIDDDSAGCQLAHGPNGGGVNLILGLVSLAALSLAGRRR